MIYWRSNPLVDLWQLNSILGPMVTYCSRRLYTTQNWVRRISQNHWHFQVKSSSVEMFYQICTILWNVRNARAFTYNGSSINHVNRFLDIFDPLPTSNSINKSCVEIRICGKWYYMHKFFWKLVNIEI